MQMVTDDERLIACLIEIYGRNRVVYDVVELREKITQATKRLFKKLDEFMWYPQLYFVASDAEFSERADLPASSLFRGDRMLLTLLFGIGKDTVSWSEITKLAANWTGEERLLFSKWIEETKEIILGAREHRVVTPHSVIVHGGLRFRFQLYQSRVQADGLYRCEFIVINEMNRPLLALATVSRMKIFLTSSSELELDRRDFEIFINRKNKEWISRGVFLDLIVWENFLDAMSRTRLQDEYDKAIRGCDLFVVLLWTKVGMYTYEEFTTLLGQYQTSNNKPLIYTYFKDAKISACN